jgi:hypothetical protein
MDSDRPAITWTRTLLDLPEDTGERFADEWEIVRRRIEMVHGVPLSHDTEPAGAPRLAASRGRDGRA